MNYQQMRAIIKITIALIFIIASYFLGSHRSNVRCKEELNSIDIQLSDYKNNLLEMKDSLALLRKQLFDCSTQKRDTLKIQIIDNSTKKGKK